MNLQQIALTADVIMAKVVYAHDEEHVVTSEERDEGVYAHCLDAVMTLSPGMSLQQVAENILVKVVYGGREGAVVTSEDRDHHEYGRCLDAAQVILDGQATAQSAN